MGYVDENLISGEVVRYRARMHWAMLVLPITVAVVFGLLAVFLWANEVRILIPLLVIAIGAIPLVTALLKRAAAEFAVTNKRVIFKSGIVQRKTAEMFLNKIESVGVDQTIGGRILKYGSVVLRGTGGSLEPFDMISHPLELRRQVQEQIGQQSDRGASAASDAKN